jgi:hypothetical protein
MLLLRLLSGQLYGFFCLSIALEQVLCTLYFWEDLFKKMHTVWVCVASC